MNAVQAISLSLGAAWASGINLYAAIFMLGLMSHTGSLVLPADLEVLGHPVVMTIAAILYCVEFFADKIPGVDSAWDAIHTFIRIPAGVVLAAGAVGQVHPVFQLAAGLLGGTLSASTHATKAGSRVLINTSPEPFSNWIASITEDLSVIIGVWTAVHHPLVFLVLLFVFVLSLIWLLPILWGGVTRVFGWFRRFFRGSEPPPAQVTHG